MMAITFRMEHLVVPRGSNSGEPLSAIDSNRQPPAIHIIDPQGDMWGVCLNRAAKWAAAVSATSAAALLAGAFVFAWQSNAKLSRLDELPNKIEQIQAQNIRNSEDIAEIKGRLNVAEAARETKGGR